MVFVVGSTLVGIEAILTTAHKSITSVLKDISFDGQIAVAVLSLVVAAVAVIAGVYPYKNQQENNANGAAISQH